MYFFGTIALIISSGKSPGNPAAAILNSARERATVPICGARKRTRLDLEPKWLWSECWVTPHDVGLSPFTKKGAHLIPFYSHPQEIFDNPPTISTQFRDSQEKEQINRRPGLPNQTKPDSPSLQPIPRHGLRSAGPTNRVRSGPKSHSLRNTGLPGPTTSLAPKRF